jgi:hypothetical protein
MPMNQFEVLTLRGVRHLAVVDTSRYDFYVGFRRVIKEL